MARSVTAVLKELRKDVATDYSKMTQELYQEIVRTTPRRSGAASRAWTRPGPVRNDNYNTQVTTNSLPYVESLEEGHSRQAPHGFIQPAIDKITRKYNK